MVFMKETPWLSATRISAIRAIGICRGWATTLIVMMRGGSNRAGNYRNGNAGGVRMLLNGGATTETERYKYGDDLH